MSVESFSVNLLQEFSDRAITFLADNGFRFLESVLILVIGLWLARKVSNLLEHRLFRTRIDPTIGPFLKNLAYYVLLTAVVVATLGHLGLNVTSFLAVLGAAGLAIGLALKDSLSNFAAGMMLLFFRFFKVGDYVTVAGTSGTVNAVNIFNTELTTPDNQAVFVPNSSILGNVIVNVTRNPTRRLDLIFGVGYADDIEKAKALLTEIIASEPRVLQEPAPVIAVSNLGESSVDIVARPWVNGTDYWGVRFDLIERVKKAFDENNISIPFPQREVHIVGAVQDSGMQGK